MIYSATAKKGFKVPGFFDPDSSRQIGFIYRPDAWVQNKVYYIRNDDDYDICIPSVFTGLYYQVATPGISGATEPAWITTPGSLTIDGTTGLSWTAVAYNLMPPALSIASSSWFVVGYAPNRVNVTQYNLGDIVQAVANGDQFICTQAGLSGTSEPSWNANEGATTNDGAVIWTFNGSIPYVTAPSFTAGTTQCTIASSYEVHDITSFTVTNRTVKNDGTTDDISQIFAVAER
jgi:hypothetical protein